MNTSDTQAERNDVEHAQDALAILGGLLSFVVIGGAAFVILMYVSLAP